MPYTVTVTVPDAQAARVRDAFCGIYGYQDEDDDGNPNPESKPQFTARKLREYAAEIVAAWELQERQRVAAEETPAPLTVT